MPGPFAEPKATNLYDDETRALRANAKPERKAAKRLKARQSDYDTFITKANAFPGEYHRPGSQKRSK